MILNLSESIQIHLNQCKSIEITNMHQEQKRQRANLQRHEVYLCAYAGARRTCGPSPVPVKPT